MGLPAAGGSLGSPVLAGGTGCRGVQVPAEGVPGSPSLGGRAPHLLGAGRTAGSEQVFEVTQSYTNGNATLSFNSQESFRTREEPRSVIHRLWLDQSQELVLGPK